MFTAPLAGTTLTSRPSLLPYTLSQVRPFPYPFLLTHPLSKIMFTAPSASPIHTGCAVFLRKRYPSLLLYLPIDAPKTINENKKSKTYIRMGRAQYRERRTGQKKEKSGRTGRAAIRRRKEEGERKVLAAGGQQRDEQKKRKSHGGKKGHKRPVGPQDGKDPRNGKEREEAPPAAARGQEQRRRAAQGAAAREEPEGSRKTKGREWAAERRKEEQDKGRTRLAEPAGRNSRKRQNAPPAAARGQHEQKRRERAAEKAAKSGRGRERRKAPPHPAEPRKGREGREKSGPSPRRRRGKRKY